MNIKRLLILTGTALLGLTLASIWMLFLSAPPETAHAAGPWYVAPGGSDSNSCLSTTTPCATINGAIGKATGGDTIYVATGTYTSTGDEVVLIDKDISLSGGWDASFTTQGGTSTIDGEESRRGITVNSSVTSTVDYFTVQNGYTSGDGGGIQSNGTLTLTSSNVSDNYASVNGGGIAVVNGSSANIIDSNIFNNNTYLRGGGIAVHDESSINLNRTKIYANTALRWLGGGISTVNSHITLSSSWVVGNAAAADDGGGIAMYWWDSADIENSIIAGNFSADSAGGIFINNSGGPCHIANSHIVGNYTDGEGAAILGTNDYSTEIEITNTLVISNTGETSIDGFNTTFLLNYCDTFGNSPDGTEDVTITRNNCLGTPPEDGLDPMMAGGALPSGVGPDYADQWLSYDYRLLAGSPATDAGTPIGAPATDIAGNPRDATPDLGAYEGELPFSITSITPNSAVANSGNLPVTVSGFNLSTPISAQIDGVSLLNPTLVSNRTLNVVVPVNDLEVGVYDLIVTIDGDMYTLNDAFTVGFAGPWYVAPSGDDEYDCLSSATPCETINGALNKSGFLDESTILVTTGVYTDTGDEVVLIAKSVTLSGGWSSAFTTQDGASIIDGEESRRGVTVYKNVNAIIDSFTIHNGYSGSEFDGGGINVRGNSTLTLTKSTVSNNIAGRGGGGVAVDVGSWAVIIGTKIYSNTAIEGSGGGIGAESGGNLNISSSWVVANSADNDGGGIAVGGSAYIENSIIAGNAMLNNGEAGGGLLFGDDGPFSIINSHIVGNYANGDGAALGTMSPIQVEVTNTLIISNTGWTGIGDKDQSGSVFVLNYCDTFSNSPDGTEGVTIIRTNCLGTPPEDGLNPMMAGGALPSGVGPDYADEWLNYDYRLLAGSPAIDAGIDAGVTRDIDNQPRPYQTPDIGAYEYWPPGVLKFIYLPLVMK